MHSFSEILDTVFLGNSLEQYCWFAGIILLGIIFKRYISKLVNRLLYRLFKRYSSHIPLKKFHEYLHKPTALFFLPSVCLHRFHAIGIPCFMEP